MANSRKFRLAKIKCFTVTMNLFWGMEKTNKCTITIHVDVGSGDIIFELILCVRRRLILAHVNP